MEEAGLAGAEPAGPMSGKCRPPGFFSGGRPGRWAERRVGRRPRRGPRRGELSRVICNDAAFRLSS